MGEKLESYTDNNFNEVFDEDIVILKGVEYEVRYISYHYVNMASVKYGQWLHWQFKDGVPELKGGKTKVSTTKSPVKETTIIKKEIVSGTYGKIMIKKSSIPYTTHIDTCSTYTKAELAEAIKTLQLIHDAME